MVNGSLVMCLVRVPPRTRGVSVPLLPKRRGQGLERVSSTRARVSCFLTVSCSEVVLWSFKPGTYQTGSFAELTPKFQTCGMRSRKIWAPSPTPNDWDPCATYRFYCTWACATWWLTRFDWLSHNGAQSHWHKGMQQLWQFRKSSWDNPARALMIS
jgi:hypothetical protein